MALVDNQISFGGLTMDAGTPFKINSIKGLLGNPPMATNDTPKLTADGVYSGYDTKLARVIDAKITVTGTSASDFDTNLAALQTAMATLMSTTSSFHFKLPGRAEQKVEARPGEWDDEILPTYKKLWIQLDLQWRCPDPTVAAA